MPAPSFECPRELSCSIEVENGPVCGSPETLPADLRAELLCPQALANAIKHEQEAGSADLDQTAHHYRLGSLFLDLSLVPQVRSSDQFSGIAFDHLSEAANGHTQEAASAALLVAYREEFDVRRGVDVPPHAKERTSANLRALAKSGHMDAPAMQTRIGTHMLYRGMRMTFPPTAREAKRLGGASSPNLDPDAFYLYTLSQTEKINHILGDGTPAFTNRIGRAVWDFDSEAARALGRILPEQTDRSAEPKEAGSIVLGWLCDGGLANDEQAWVTVRMMRARLRDKVKRASRVARDRRITNRRHGQQ